MDETEYKVEILYRGRWVEVGMEEVWRGDHFRLRGEDGELVEGGLVWKALSTPRKVGEKWLVESREGGRWKRKVRQ